MSEYEFNKLFASNLTHFLRISGKTQAELAKYVGVSTASVSNWCKGIKLPRMDKVDKICEYLQIKRSNLMESASDQASAHLDAHSLRPDESTLLSHYNNLNDTGKEQAQLQVMQLTQIPAYQDKGDAEQTSYSLDVG